MSDTRFILLGIALFFAGFILLVILDGQFREYALQANEFGDCYDYTDDGQAIPINCETIMQYRSIVFGVSIALIGAGIIVLIKSVRGRWDQDVKNDEMVGPKRDPRNS